MTPEYNVHKTWLIFDVGTTGIKAAIVSSLGEVLTSAYQRYETLTAEGGVVEQDANDWWQAALATLTQLDVTSVDAIALTGQMQNVVLLDGKGELLRPVILYSDVRAHLEAELLSEEADNLRQLTGNEQGAASLLAKLLWLEQREPEVLKKSTHMLMGAADYLAFKLTGRAVSDTTTASTTGLMNLETRAWLDSDMLERLGIAKLKPLFPKLISGGTLVASVTAELGKKLGLKASTPVFLGPGDAVSTTLGVGSGAAGKPYAYVGTSGWVAYTSTQRGDPIKGVFSLAHPELNKVICIAPILTAAGNFDWIKDLLDVEDHLSMIEAALSKEPSKLIYLPYLHGERSPFSDPFARAAFIGLETSHDKYHLARAVLEGVAFAYKHALDALMTDVTESLTLTGGGTRSQDFCQLLADITDLNVSVADQAVNAGLLGTLFASQHAYEKKLVPSRQFKPSGQFRKVYAQKYAWYLAAYPALKSLFLSQGSH